MITIFIYTCSSSKDKKIRYFDENNVEISKSKFNRIRSTNRLLDLPGDSINQKKLTKRENRGRIDDRASLELLLENATNREIDSVKPIVVIYYPGKDPCNSSGTSDSTWVRNWHGQLEKGLMQVANVKPIYIYKDNDGLEMYNGLINWYKDPERTIEKLFFKHHYPCNSLVVIAANGNYVSYFGEFGMEYVWKATQMMNK
ncbi:hypothetical protein FJ651_00400 [Paucihalobacter ruber]|uniref:Uncharacterized protein n=1 Tax=Paucihalobacter ruber TaxID=2567861 RepID=A0A506PQF2_9FLAO|nr:hypothetical protein [Paucihalobacter ruber]TPV35415.1 hypothetical protein FJ651_00400 [Paucihalobacter ruber]